MKIRASGLHKLMTRSRNKGQLSETAKTAVLEQVLYDVYGFNKQIHTKYTKKGIELEEAAIEAVSLLKFVKMHKNSERREDKHFTGECDLLTDNAIRDIKCSWDFSTHPFTQQMAEDKVKKSGYDWQGQVYMHLWDKDEHWVDFVLLPTPSHLLGRDDDPTNHQELVDAIPLQKRITSVTICRDKAMIDQALAQIALAKGYYDELVAQIKEQK